ncbi:pyridoxamine 5'-phosphate oxidase family protein [Nonomuraea rhodomycinica]|uniref:Pyridoxamine 5'-phosphate oxidase family protein n=1 Tax=Nonomuraea rhodomycinica TaxID=1712872 RepID=A0A7Y6IM92_9ACTN|nr:pyridoxamine 5'-phosphate oxidase family protein [Nonomuraea rhodomycinica]NUW39504.1 pyridoxamine 5'-phosphate oxidase family protein [Nonomuraea rhodomycinica]
MQLDSSGLQVLSDEECFGLLSAAPIGRIVFTDHALPAVQPVNFHLDGRTIVIRTSIGSKLAAATRRAVVAFEADEFDRELRVGWSVTAVGQAREVTDPDELDRLAALPLTTWAPGSRDHYIVVEAEHVSGRRITGTPPDGAAARRNEEGAPARTR